MSNSPKTELEELRTRVSTLQTLLLATQESNEQNVANILESMSDAFFSVDKNWIITRVNAQHEKSTVYKRQDQIGRNLLELFFHMPEAKFTQYWFNYHRAMEDRVKVEFEEYYPPFDLWTQVRAFPTSDGGLAIFFTDITAQKKISQTVEAERQKFEAIFVESPATMALLRGPEFIFEKVNSRYAQLMGGRDLVGKSLHDALPELVGQPFHDIMKEVFETGRPFIAKGMMAKLIRKPGGSPEDTYFDFTYSRVNDGSGKPYGIYIHAEDITERVMSRRKLEEIEQQQKLALAGGKLGTWSISIPDGALTSDHRFREIHGIVRDHDNVNDAIDRASFPEDIQRINSALENAIKNKTPYECEYRSIGKDGIYRWVYARGETRYDPETGEAVSVNGVAADIHERKMAEMSLQEALTARDEFLSIASHELKTPLTSLKLQVQLHLRTIKKTDPSPYTPARIEKILEQTDKQVNRLNRLVDDMLDVSRIRSGKLAIVREQFNFYELLVEVIERLKEQFLANQTPLPVVEMCKNVEGEWDRLRLEQVITNLLTNAIRYGNKKPISVRLESDENSVSLIIEDHGMGIPKESHEKIFNRFERAIHANEVSGLGLGLFITKQIVLAHGGSVSVKSAIGEGSTFTVQIPKAPAPEV